MKIAFFVAGPPYHEAIRKAGQQAMRDAGFVGPVQLMELVVSVIFYQDLPHGILSVMAQVTLNALKGVCWAEDHLIRELHVLKVVYPEKQGVHVLIGLDSSLQRIPVYQRSGAVPVGIEHESGGSHDPSESVAEHGEGSPRPIGGGGGANRAQPGAAGRGRLPSLRPSDSAGSPSR